MMPNGEMRGWYSVVTHFSWNSEFDGKGAHSAPPIPESPESCLNIFDPTPRWVQQTLRNNSHVQNTYDNEFPRTSVLRLKVGVWNWKQKQCQEWPAFPSQFTKNSEFRHLWNLGLTVLENLITVCNCFYGKIFTVFSRLNFPTLPPWEWRLGVGVEVPPAVFGLCLGEEREPKGFSLASSSLSALPLLLPGQSPLQPGAELGWQPARMEMGRREVWWKDGVSQQPEREGTFCGPAQAAISRTFVSQGWWDTRWQHPPLGVLTTLIVTTLSRPTSLTCQ